MSDAGQLLPVEGHHAGLMGYGPPVEALVVVLLGRRKSPWQGRLN